MSPILGSVLPVVKPPALIKQSDASKYDAYFKIAPRVQPGGSEAGTVLPAAVLDIKRDRLFASVDELMFSTAFSGGARIPNTASGSSTKPNLITRQVLDRTKFFLTANSVAPEVTLLNTPRVSIWPVYGNPSDSPSVQAQKQTSFDQLSEFCSTIGKKQFCFAHIDPRSCTKDFTGRNVQLYRYLQTMTSLPFPGFGPKTFAVKYAADRDQIITEIFDYIRCTNLQDHTAPFTYTSIYPNLGAGEVFPIQISNTQGFGRFLGISEAVLVFYQLPASNGNVGLGACLLFQFDTPMHGLPCMHSTMSYTVTGLDAISVSINNGPFQPLQFPKSGTNYLDWDDLSTYHGRSLGGTEGALIGILNSSGALKSMTPGSSAHNQYPFVTPSAPTIVLPKSQAASAILRFRANDPSATKGAVNVTIQGQNSSGGTETLQTLNLAFSEGEVQFPPGYSARSAGDYTQVIQSVDSAAALEVTGPNGALTAGGDSRMVEAMQSVPAVRFGPHLNYRKKIQFAHSLQQAVGEPYTGATFGKLVNVASYIQQNATNYNNFHRQPAAPSFVGNAVTRAGPGSGPGDWDTGLGDQKDGAYINKPDEGDSAFTDSQNGQLRLPYDFGYGQGFASATRTNFSPMRQVPSPMMFGSLPTGVQRFLPWQTLCFSPKPEDPSHPGNQDPKDHLLADLFWMPAVEPYAISEPFATAGKVNMNYQIQPFTYIKRYTGMYAVLKSTKFMAMPLSIANVYKPIDPGNNSQRAVINRQSIALDPIHPDGSNVPETLKAFDNVFTSKGEIFKSATQICEMSLVPKGASASSMASFWKTNSLTGDNLREKPYVDIYPRLTTKSNTFTVHMRVQALKKARNTAPDKWVAGKDQVLGEYRGSAIIERYIDVNDPNLPDFATIPLSDPAADINQYYKMRIVATKRFTVD